MALDLILKQVTDPYIRENFRRLQEFTGDSITNIINQQVGLVVPSPDDLLKKITTSVVASSSSVVDTVLVANFVTLRYFITIWNTANNKTKVLDMVVMKDSASNVSDNVFGRVGTRPFDVQITSAVSGSSHELTITNNELFGVQVEIGKLLLGKP